MNKYKNRISIRNTDRVHLGAMEKFRDAKVYLLLLLILSVAMLAGCGSSGGNSDVTAPTATSTAPLYNTTDVALNASIAATFSEAMSPLTITDLTFTVMQGATPVAGTVTYSGLTAVFTPGSALMASTTYTATITTGAMDMSANALASNHVWSFTTGSVADATVPRVVLTAPGSAATGVAFNTKAVVTFSEAMNPQTITNLTFILTKGATPVAGTVTYSGVTAVFKPNSALAASTTYTATMTTGAKDLAGNALATDYVWNFTTGAAADTTAPTVLITDPDNGDIEVLRSKKPYATFSEDMDPLTTTSATFTLKQGLTPVTGSVAYVGRTATFTPDGGLADNTTYTATITTGAKDLAGNALASNHTWIFTTTAAVSQGPLPVDLGSAGDFTILATSGISTTGVTSVVGDIGLSPAAATFITGFAMTMDSTNEFATSIYVVGKAYASDFAPPTPAKMTAAISHMEGAFTDAAGRTLPDFTELYAGDISGQTLVPGLYKWGTGVLITSAGVTLSGGANDVWIFQIAQDLTVENSAIVTLLGDAQAKNVFWQVSGQATLGTAVAFQGNILSKTLISLNTGATMTGRALAQTAVTLDAATVTLP